MPLKYLMLALLVWPICTVHAQDFRSSTYKPNNSWRMFSKQILESKKNDCSRMENFVLPNGITAPGIDCGIQMRAAPAGARNGVVGINVGFINNTDHEVFVDPSKFLVSQNGVTLPILSGYQVLETLNKGNSAKRVGGFLASLVGAYFSGRNSATYESGSFEATNMYGNRVSGTYSAIGVDQKKQQEDLARINGANQDFQNSISSQEESNRRLVDSQYLQAKLIGPQQKFSTLIAVKPVSRSAAIEIDVNLDEKHGALILNAPK